VIGYCPGGEVKSAVVVVIGFDINAKRVEMMKQGIDPSRIEVRTGGAGTKTAEYWVVPAGATFSGSGTETVDESKVKAVPDHPAPAKKKAAKPKAQ